MHLHLLSRPSLLPIYPIQPLACQTALSCRVGHPHIMSTQIKSQIGIIGIKGLQSLGQNGALTLNILWTFYKDVPFRSTYHFVACANTHTRHEMIIEGVFDLIVASRRSFVARRCTERGTIGRSRITSRSARPLSMFPRMF